MVDKIWRMESYDAWIYLLILMLFLMVILIDESIKWSAFPEVSFWCSLLQVYQGNELGFNTVSTCVIPVEMMIGICPALLPRTQNLIHTECALDAVRKWGVN